MNKTKRTTQGANDDADFTTTQYHWLNKNNGIGRMQIIFTNFFFLSQSFSYKKKRSFLLI